MKETPKKFVVEWTNTDGPEDYPKPIYKDFVESAMPQGKTILDYPGFRKNVVCDSDDGDKKKSVIVMQNCVFL